MPFITLDKGAYFHNLTLISQKLGGKDKLMCVLKDNAYGHGAIDIASMAKEFGIDKVAVKSQDEALVLKDFFKTILILSHIPNGNENAKFIYCLNDKRQIPLFKKGTSINLVLDTCMKRNGIELKDIKQTIKDVYDNGLALKGVSTHFRCADEVNSDFFVQKFKFNQVKDLVKKEALKFGFKDIFFHSHNSAAMERAQDFNEDFARVGIAQFGYSQFANLDLKPILNLYANKISQRKITKGQKVGYGAKFEAKEEMDIATYDIGYGDGLFRCKKSKNELLPNGACIYGRMSMDSFVTDDFGDEICVMNDARIWARFFDTIEYEILVKLSPFIPKKIIN